MKFYDNCDNFRKRIHTVRVTFQTQNYIGHIAYKMGGNCKGLDIMGFDPGSLNQDDIDVFTENDCSLSFNENNELFEITLISPGGGTLFCEREDEDFKDLIVAIEIIDCKLDGEENA